MAVLKTLRTFLWSAMLGALLGAMPAAALTAPNEYQIKAVFIFNFSRFIEWPTSTFPSAEAPFVVGILGHDPFGPYLDEVVKGESVGGHPLVIRHVRNATEASGCQILFIPQSENRQLDELVSALASRSTLTVSDLPGGAQRGLMIRLVIEQGRVRMRINAEAARAASLTISSNLLRAAEIVAPDGGT